jgi:hypothetical protein
MISKVAVKKLRDLYLDQMVTIYLKDMNVVTVDENSQEIGITAMRQGYVLDICQNYFYLGLPDGTITTTIAHELAQMVEIEFAGSELFDTDMPSSEDEVH